MKRDGVSSTTNQHGTTTIQTNAMLFITEGNVYRLITHSKLPSAERFEAWVFEEVLPSPRRAVVEEIKQAMLSQGALGACMSGTGPTVFGIFAGETEAEAAWRSLKGSYDETFLTHSV